MNDKNVIHFNLIWSIR